MTNPPRRRIKALIAATNRQPVAGLLTTLAYLMATAGVVGLVFKIVSFIGYL